MSPHLTLTLTRRLTTVVLVLPVHTVHLAIIRPIGEAAQRRHIGAAVMGLFTS